MLYFGALSSLVLFVIALLSLVSAAHERACGRPCGRLPWLAVLLSGLAFAGFYGAHVLLYGPMTARTWWTG